MIKVIILNGPPNCGKDTIGDILAKRFPNKVLLTTFKHDLIEDTAKYFDVSLEWFKKLCGGRIEKEESLAELGGKSPRGALQFVSEDVMKPRHGKGYYGCKAVARINYLRSLDEDQLLPALEYIIFTDGGFMEEAAIVGGEFDTTIMQLRGRGTFKGDTRGFITHEACRNAVVQLVDGEEEEGATEVASRIGLQ